MRTYFRVISYGKPFFWLGGIAIIGIIIYSIFSTATLLSTIPFLEILFHSSTSDLPSVAPEINFSDPGSLKNYGYFKLGQAIETLGKQTILIYFCIGLIIITLIKNASRYLASWSISPLELRILEALRNHLFVHLTHLGMPFFTKKRKGDLIGLMVSDVQVIQESVIGTVQTVIREPIMMVVLLGTLIFISWKLTLFTLIILPLTGFFINLIAKTLKRKAKLGQEALGSLISILDEFIGGIRIVKAFQKEAYETKRYENKNLDYTLLQINIRRRVELASPVTEVLSILVVCVIIIYAGTLILEDNQQTTRSTEFIGFIIIFSQMLAPIKNFSNAVAKVQKGIAAFLRLEEFLGEQPSIQETDDPISTSTFEKNIRFEGVWFHYQEGVDVLKDINFEVEKGQTVALVGPSGGGKSTLVDLVPRFYDPTKGRILLDGKDLRDLSIENVRSLIGNVTQEGILFHDTIQNNIAYGLPDVSLESVIEAAIIANAHDFIMELPDQYQTVIGERGTILSGGQRQRISIARAVLRNPAILILDEATSNLDTQSEKLVQEALNNLMANRTSIVIAHRLSTILEADLILTIQDGRIVERGRHADLLEAGGMYKRLYDLQFEG